MSDDPKITKEEFSRNGRRAFVHFLTDATTGLPGEVQPRSVWRERFEGTRVAIAKLAVDTKRAKAVAAEKQAFERQAQGAADAGLSVVSKAEMIERYDTELAAALKERDDLRSKLATAEADLAGALEELRARKE